VPITVVEQGMPDVADGMDGLVSSVEDGTDGLRDGICGCGLTPPTPSSVEPMGMPTRPAAEGAAIPVGDEAEAAGLERPVVTLAHVPEAVPIVPPPSKRFTEPGMVGVDAPGFVPEIFPAAEFTPEHVAMLPVGASPSGDIPDVVGLTPIDPNSVLPSGIPVPGIGSAGPIPSGEVMPSGDGALPLSWADAQPLPNISSASAVIAKRVIVFSSFCSAPVRSTCR